MPRVFPFTVIADLPPELEALRDLSNNLWWTWSPSARDLFARTHERFLERRNPVEVVHSLSREELALLAQDDAYLAQLKDVHSQLNSYLKGRSWWDEKREAQPNLDSLQIAYFCAEFGLHESLPIYSGGLGVLAGDYLKAASDLGLPMVAIGLLYYEGYFHQYLNADGWQQESSPQIDITSLPVSPVRNSEGRPVTVTVTIHGRTVHLQAVRADVGRVPLYLLDTNLEQNDPADREITARLYGGDEHMRIKQEIVLGIGGLRMLRALGMRPGICHMNEGHSAFLALEQVRQLMQEQHLDFPTALETVSNFNIFTTHTPVPAGNDVFHPALFQEYFMGLAAECGVDVEQFLRLGRVHPADAHEGFSVTVLALRTAGLSNGVSKLHGHVTRTIWNSLWPELALDEVPIGHVTNGVHTLSWASKDIIELLERYLSPKWRQHISQEEVWSRIMQIPDEELWRIRSRRRGLLVNLCRERMQLQLRRRGAGRVELDAASGILNPDALTIGFARRFAAYKRGNLVLRDIERLIAILSDTERPVQFIFAGKAHPADRSGKEIIAAIIHAARRPELKDRFVFLEDYEMGIARALVQGVDVWLNNPRRPLEASGTSGMKVAINGGLNLSVFDGWWCEAFDGQNGWCIGQGEEYQDPAYQDEVESRSIYDLLEREVIPTFYDRTELGVPRQWLELVKHSMRTIIPAFSSERMAKEYCDDYYIPLLEQHRRRLGDGFQGVRERVAQKAMLREHWHEVQILDVNTGGAEHVAMGMPLNVTVTAQLGPLKPEQIAVQAFYGDLDAQARILNGHVVHLVEVEESGERGVYRFRGVLSAERAGRHGFSLRIVPVISGQPSSTEPGLITWAV